MLHPVSAECAAHAFRHCFGYSTELSSNGPAAFHTVYSVLLGQDSSVSIANRYGLEGPGIESQWGEVFRTHPDRPRGPPSLLYNEYRVFPGEKSAGAWR